MHAVRALCAGTLLITRRMGRHFVGRTSAYSWIPCDLFGRPVHCRSRASILAALVVFFCLCLADASDAEQYATKSAERRARNDQLESSIANPGTKLSATTPGRSSEQSQHASQLMRVERTAFDSRCARVLHALFMPARFTG
jgi:hypothetical protein